MAEVTGLRNNALPYPVYGVPWGVVFPILDNTGAAVAAAAGLDTQISKNGDATADCTNEATAIDEGLYYLLLTGTEMTADVIALVTKTSTTDAKPTFQTLYPRKLPSLRSGTAQAGAAGTITLDAGSSAVDDFYNGCLIVGTLDSNVEARVITDYTGSTKVASVTPNWNTTPDSDDTFVIYLPEGRQINQANVTHAAEVAWGSGAITAGAIATDAIDADAIADNAINAAAIAADAITSAKLADGAITAAKIATNAIDDDALAADAVTAIVAGVLTTAMTESYAANGAAPTLAQGVFAVHQYLMDFSISGDAYTVQRLNGTTAFTVTLNDATTPTGATRA